MKIAVAILETVDMDAWKDEGELFVIGGSPIFRFKTNYTEKILPETIVCEFEILGDVSEGENDEIDILESSCALFVVGYQEMGSSLHWGLEFRDGKWVNSIGSFRYFKEGDKRFIRGEISKT